MNARPLSGSVAFITGAGSGLGEAFARRLALDGAHVVATDIDQSSAQRVANDISGSSAFLDVVDSGAWTTAIDRVLKDHGRLDILINNAGIAPRPDDAAVQRMIDNHIKRSSGRIEAMEPLDFFTSISDEAFDRMLKVHLYGTFYGCRAALSVMQPARRGVILNVSSIFGYLASVGAMHYGVAKAGIISLTKSLAAETAHLGIRVNALCPGYVDTPLLAPLSEVTKTLIVQRIGVGRLAKPEELAEVARFACGPESSYCTGEIFTATGGYGF